MDFKLTTEKERLAIINYIGKLDLDKNKYHAKVSKRVIKRSLSANALYHLWVSCIASETGHTHDEIHSYFKKELLTPTISEVFGDKIETYTTTTLTTGQFKEYLDNIQAIAASELGIRLPDPKDKDWEHFYEFYRYKI